MTDLDELCINTIRFLAVDAVERANSGHPGMPLGAAPMAYVLWDRFLRHDPHNPEWPDRDRFVLSAGHASAMLYALLHLTGYDLPLEQLRQFRQWGSQTPGHPEYGLTPGVEATTGPLGQGFGMGVGMAIAERYLTDCFNVDGFNLVNHFTYAICSDGDLMEGVSSEAASLAGTLKLGKLIYLYDDNHISIEGNTDKAFTEDVRRRFEAYGWHVQRVADGNDLDAIEVAIRSAQKETVRPSLIIVRTHIGFGSPKQDTGEVHGSPLGPDAVEATKKHFGWPLEPTFRIPEDALSHFREAENRGRNWRTQWESQFNEYRQAHSELATRFERQTKGEMPEGWDADLPSFTPDDGPMATRKASGKIMNELSGRLPELVGGSADLAPSTKTLLTGYGNFGSDEHYPRNLHFGVREHAMGTIVNGMALHRGVVPYGATFLIFSDYMRPTLRLAALMGIHSIFIYTHDSIGLGEDGPTHQPVEHLASLRAIPDFRLIRPADANETAAAWRVALASNKPVALVLTRQSVPVLDPKAYAIAEGVGRGAYVLADGKARPDVILIGTGSEVQLLLEARSQLANQGISARVVSMPSWDLFAEQPPDYQERVLPRDVKARLAVEAASPFGWCRWVGDTGDVIGIDRFGSSAPGKENFQHYGFTVDNVVERAKALLKR